MGRISGAPSDVVEAAPPARTPPRPLASSRFAVRRGRQPLDLEEAGSAAAYVTAANEFLTASGNVLSNATRRHQEGERSKDEAANETVSPSKLRPASVLNQYARARPAAAEGALRKSYMFC